MGTGDFLGHPNNNNLTIYVTKLYNEAKYLEPQIPFKSFVRHVSKHLPKDVQTTLMTKEIEDMNELERILDILQSIRDREGGRRIQQNNNHHHVEHNQNKNNNYRGYNNNVHRDNVNKPGEWSCSRCKWGNFASRQRCYKCNLPREEQRRRNETRQYRGTNNYHQGPPRDHQIPTTSNHRQQPEN